MDTTVPSRTLTEEERQTILSRCPSLREPSQPTPQLLACLAYWREQAAKARKSREGGT